MSESSWNTLEQEFLHYANLLEWISFFKQLKQSRNKTIISMSDWLSAIEVMGVALLVKGEVYKFITTVFGETGEQVSETITNEIRCFNQQRTAKAFLKSFEMLQKAGIEPQKVELKTLIPILENISLEEDETLQSKWENLLRTAIATGEIHPSYISILKDLDALDAKVLEKLNKTERQRSHYGRLGECRILRELIGDITSNNKEIIELFKNPESRLDIEDIEKAEEYIELMMQSTDNLIRLKLIESDGERIPLRQASMINIYNWGYESLSLSSLGKRFLTTVSPIS